MPEDTDLVIGNGPYMITDFVADQYITLTANENYVGDNTRRSKRSPSASSPTRWPPSRRSQNGEVEVISPQATADVADALAALDGVTVIGGDEGAYEHIDLQFDQSKSGTSTTRSSARRS